MGVKGRTVSEIAIPLYVLALLSPGIVDDVAPGILITIFGVLSPLPPSSRVLRFPILLFQRTCNLDRCSAPLYVGLMKSYTTFRGKEYLNIY